MVCSIYTVYRVVLQCMHMHKQGRMSNKLNTQFHHTKSMENTNFEVHDVQKQYMSYHVQYLRSREPFVHDIPETHTHIRYISPIAGVVNLSSSGIN